MKEQVKGIVYDFKDIGWSVHKLEEELSFSNGTLGKFISGKAGISEYRLSKLFAFHKERFGKMPTVTPELEEMSKENNIPENRDAIENARSGAVKSNKPKPSIVKESEANDVKNKKKPVKLLNESGIDYAIRLSEWNESV